MKAISVPDWGIPEDHTGDESSRAEAAPGTFAASIEGARGTLVFGNGLDALRVEDVYDAGGYLEVTTTDGRSYHVRTEAVAYFRFTEDE